MFAIPHWLDHSIVPVAYGFALLKGGKPERCLAGIWMTVWLWHRFFHPMIYGQQLTYVLTLDACLGLITITLAMHFNRWWLLVASMASVLRVATDCIALLMPLQPWALGTALFLWSYVQLGALTAGTWTSWRGRRAATPLAPA